MVEVTYTSIVHVPPAAAIEPLVRVKELAEVETVPPPHCGVAGVLKKVIPSGKVSVKVMPVNPVSDGAVRVILNLELTPGEMEVGLKDLATPMGGAVETTVMLFDVMV